MDLILIEGSRVSSGVESFEVKKRRAAKRLSLEIERFENAGACVAFKYHRIFRGGTWLEDKQINR